MTATLRTQLLAAGAVVMTNRRILFFPLKRDGKWRASVRAVAWRDLEEIKPKSLVGKIVTFKARDGAKTSFANFRRGDGKKIPTITAAL